MSEQHSAPAAGLSRRSAIGVMAATGLVAAMPAWATNRLGSTPFKISLAEWSLNKPIFAGELDHLDFARTARESFGIDAVEYVSQFFQDKPKDMDYLGQMRKRAAEAGVKSLLIMVDGAGDLGDPDKGKRAAAVDRHKPWVDAARVLGCHSIRVNAVSRGTYEEQARLVGDGLRLLTEFGESMNINVIVENHGGLSSNAAWLSKVIRTVDHPMCGTLPDFGNFWIEGDETYDRYKGVEELMPYAKAVSAKSYDFDDDGNETTIDFERMMRIVVDARYRGHVGIEYEGGRLSPHDGIIATKKLLERVREELA